MLGFRPLTRYRRQPEFLPLGIIFFVALCALCLPAAAQNSEPYFNYILNISPGDVLIGGGGARPAKSLEEIKHDFSQPSSLEGHVVSAGGALAVDCYTTNGDVPAFAPDLSQYGVTSCQKASSYNLPITLTTDAYHSSANTVSGNVTSISLSMVASPANTIPPGGKGVIHSTLVLGFVSYAQVFQAPVPPGSTITLTFSATGTGPGVVPAGEGNVEAIAFASSDCSDPSCSVSGGVETPGSDAQTFTLGPLTIGPSGQYTLSAQLQTIFLGMLSQSLTSAPPLTITLNMGCNFQAIDVPDPGTVSGSWWNFDYDVSDENGLEVKNVTLGARPMAAQMSAPFFNLITTDFSGSNCSLEPDGDGDCSSKLVAYAQTSTAVSAIYVVSNIPSDTASCLVITENFEFDPPVPGDLCEPTANVGCARFKPSVSYVYLPDEPSKQLSSIEIPMRFDFTDGNPVSSSSLILQPQSVAVGLDNTTSGLPIFPFGNPVPMEQYIPNVIENGNATGQADSFLQTYLGIVDEPATIGSVTECSTCVHVHWRWDTSFGSIPGFADNGGNPLIPPGSTQTVDIAVTGYPDDMDSDCANQSHGGALPGQPTVFWYCGKGNQSFDTFFSHGGFFNPLPGGQPIPNITVTRGGFRINKATAEWTQLITLTNNGTNPLPSPVALVFESLSPTATLVGSAGVTTTVTPLGSPYLFAPIYSFAPIPVGQSVTMTVNFANPKNAAINYSLQVLAAVQP